MADRNEILAELRSVIREQSNLLRLILFTVSEGPVLREGQWLSCRLEHDQARAMAAVAMGAGQSLGTVLTNSAERGLPVRDLYPIARSVVEGFINAAFFATQPVEVSTRALAHIHYAAWKHQNRLIGTGNFMMVLGDDPAPRATAAKLFPEFSGRGQDSWCSVDTPSKINRIGQIVQASGGAFLGAYGTIYSVSSEIIHGSVYGMSYFMSAYTGQEQTAEAFQRATEEQMIDILSAVSHAASGFISAYASVHQYGPLIFEDSELFKKLFKAVTGDVWIAAATPAVRPSY